MIKHITLPDIGDFDAVEVIEILVNTGDIIDIDDSIITLESDKASMEIPAPFAGTVAQINLNLGDKIKQGDELISLEVTAPTSASEQTQGQIQTSSSQIIDVNVPDIGDFDAVEVIEILVNTGDIIDIDDSIITLESDKASIEIPSPVAGIITDIKVALGDKIAQGDLILNIQSNISTPPEPAQTPVTHSKHADTAVATPPIASVNQPTPDLPKGDYHASPSIRKLAREVGVDLSNVVGTGQKGRILDADLKTYVKQIITSSSTGILPKLPVIDFSKFGEVQIQPLSRINKLSGKHLSACWLNIPHVTQFDQVNIEQMEAFRQQQKAKNIKLTPLVFIMKAVVQALKQHPRFNASLDESGENLIIKKYFNLGIAMDTPNGLVVPVVRDVEQKSLTELADELRKTSAKAREGKLKPNDMQGAGFTISSLGGIGGTQFSPIVNAPEVAILGVSRTQIQPIWDGKKFIPKPILPLALSYDHRVIDGAQGARFMANLNHILQDIREILL